MRWLQRQTGEELIPLMNGGALASWLTNLPLNNVFLRGALGPRLMDGLTEAGSISQTGFPSMSAAESTGRAPTSVTRPGCN